MSISHLLFCLLIFILQFVVIECTWSVILINRKTKEVGVASVTCVESYDLLALLPVVAVGKGGGACQSAADPDGIRRPVIYKGLQAQTDPKEILVQLSSIPGHQNRQYGIVDTLGRAVTFSGSLNSQWAGGFTGNFSTPQNESYFLHGEIDDMTYAIQGNILTGECVVKEAEKAIIETIGDIPEKMMVSLQRSRAQGGDGRCSCSQIAPVSCGCPPNKPFTKCGHIGFILSARIGDSDGSSCDRNGCANGNYYLKLNVPYQRSSNPDPVDQLQKLFDDWRNSQKGLPDGSKSKTIIRHIHSDEVELEVILLDRDDNQISSQDIIKKKIRVLVEFNDSPAFFPLGDNASKIESKNTQDLLDNKFLYRITIPKSIHRSMEVLKVTVFFNGDQRVVLSPFVQFSLSN